MQGSQLLQLMEMEEQQTVLELFFILQNSKAFPMSKTKYYYGYPIDFHSMEDGIYWVEIQSNIAKNNPTTSNGSYIQLSTKLDGVGIFISRNDGQLYIQYKKNGIWNDWITYLSK